ncbi:single-stranded DNA-binding protein [Jiangella ureilytica]|uniref:Single-stranded DNA-binding protein n=1 Tax=Jiangella ureilytica TaxID=2530374 RepID=A0A4R4RGL5_9ACTN|nr:single-stranded DNA-binding protein [Jiangella ureilytica]TDC48571.1 single-stranded DNA-binding protein [Jiangella ureilytica]
MNTATVPAEHLNEVRLVGRLSAEPEVILLPSGDEIVSARLVVQRPRPPAGLGAPRRVDTVTCTAWASAQRRKLRVLEEGDTVEITGALRRRFWRSGGAGQSTFEIEIDSAKCIARRPPVKQKKQKARKADPPSEPATASPERRLVLVGAEAAGQ